MAEKKYTPDKLIPMFRKAARLRNEMIDAGFTDNGGAIHSAERILDILGLRIVYPGLSHVNKLRDYPNAEFSTGAREAVRNGERILIEHVAPTRDFTRHAIALIDNGATDRRLTKFVQNNYRLVLLNERETKRLNATNRTKMSEDRLGEAGIKMSES